MEQADNKEKNYNPLYLTIVSEKPFPAFGVRLKRDENKLMKSISFS